jgi:hypothetical protein
MENLANDQALARMHAAFLQHGMHQDARRVQLLMGSATDMAAVEAAAQETIKTALSDFDAGWPESNYANGEPKGSIIYETVDGTVKIIRGDDRVLYLFWSDGINNWLGKPANVATASVAAWKLLQEWDARDEDWRG